MKIFEKIKNSTAIKIVLGSLIIIIILFMVLVGGITYTIKYKIHDIDSKLSPDNTHELILQQEELQGMMPQELLSMIILLQVLNRVI